MDIVAHVDLECDTVSFLDWKCLRPFETTARTSDLTRVESASAAILMPLEHQEQALENGRARTAFESWPPSS